MHTHDFVGIGLGPFNLGLACLTDPIDGFDGVFLEAQPQFDWHPGMMLPDATLQVPFLADLVTMADPTSPYSFLNYLKESGRLYSFYIRESFYPLRAEYNQYCQWAAAKLGNLRFGSRATTVEHDGHAYVVHTLDERTGRADTVRGRKLVLGVGTSPVVPHAVQSTGGPWVHSASYLDEKETLQQERSITIVGSGQSAAEIYLDLLGDIESFGYTLNWVTRSPRFFPLEYTKLTLEMTSPEYTSYFQSLPAQTRDRLVNEQKGLYKGISSELIDTIFETLYRKQLYGEVPTMLLTNTALVTADWDGASFRLGLVHEEQRLPMELETGGLVLATGYAARTPSFVDPIRDRIRWDDRGRFAAGPTYAVDEQYSIFVQNAEEHTHGFVAPDLGMGAYRNSVIIASMLGREVYPVEKRIGFQHFGVPDALRVGP